jgi:tRNA (guanine-N7-)-methyltransferase
MPSKLEKFADFDQFPNCFSLHFQELSNPFPMKGKWRPDCFGNEHPIVLELGCGRGEYTVGLAQGHPDKNFIGIDVKGARMWTGAKQALDLHLKNAAFLRTRIDFLEHCFSRNEVEEIWLTFPDPQPQKSRERKRLVNPRFLDIYRKVLRPGGILHLKTDSPDLFEYAGSVIQAQGLEIIHRFDDLYRQCPGELSELTGIKTWYERLFSGKGETIRYISFRLS